MASNYSYIGNGKIYLRNLEGTTGLLEVGNASQLEFSVEEELLELPDYRLGGGGLYNSVSRVTKVTGTMMWHDLSPTNLAIAMRGGSNAVATGAVVDEVHKAYDDALIPLNYLPDQSTIVVKDSATGLITYVADTDYTTTRAGIVVLGSGSIVNAADLKISYTKLASHTIETLTTVGQVFELVFDGLNEAQTGKPVTVRVYRFKPSPASALAMIGSDFAELEITGTVLAETSISGTGVSQYMRIDMQDL